MPLSPLSDAAANLRVRALRLERAGDLSGALVAYEAALGAAPDHPDLLAALANLAGRMAMHEVAVSFWERAAAVEPGSLEAADGRARALSALGRFDEATGILQAAILAHPLEPRLWTALGIALTQQGRTETALTFFDEAIRLDPQSVTAAYNRGGAYFDLGRLDEAAADFETARKLARKPSDVAMIGFAAATLNLARGALGQGWDDYEVRFSRDLARSVLFEAPGRRWTPTTSLSGKHLLVLAEQGLGDEIMFANLLPDVLAELGSEGLLTLAVEPRLVALFQRSFPTAQVVAHVTDRMGDRRRRTAPAPARTVDIWAPLASLLRRYRRTLTDFPSRPGYLLPAPGRIAHWRGWLGDGPPAIGLTWRSGQVLGDRRRYYPPQEQWTPLLRTPGVRFVNVQYGDVDAELRAFAGISDVEILQPPDLNIREDIDDLAALCAALDLIVGVQNATVALAGACGRPLIVVSSPSSWPRLGTDGYPWYPASQGLACTAPGAWEPVMIEVARLAAQRFAKP